MLKQTLSAIAIFFAISAFGAEKILENYSGEFIRGIHKVEGVKSHNTNALCMEGNTLFCGAGQTLYALDATEPLNPKILSKTNISGLIRQITAQNGYVFAACRESGVWIFDVKDPHNISVVTRYDPVELSTGIEVAGDVLFLGTRQNGVECVDISDIKNPTHIRIEKTEESQSVTYRDGILYSGEWGMHCISVIDASDMSKLKTLKKVNLQGYGDGVWTFGNYLYASTGHHLTDKKLSQEQRNGNGHGLEIFDITDPVNPKPVSRIGFDNSYVRSVDYWTPRPCSDGKYVICADSFNGLYVVDASNPKEPKTISRLHFKRDDGRDAAVSSIAVGNGVVYTTVFSDFGLLALDCPEAKPCVKEKGAFPTNCNYRFPYSTDKSSHFVAWKPDVYSPVRGLSANGDILYAACSYGGLHILKLDKKGNHVQIGKGPMKYAGDVKYKNGRLFVAEGFEGLGVYQVEKNGALKEIGRFNSFSKGKDLDVCLWVFTPDDKYVVASTRVGGNYYIDIENFPEMKMVARLGSGPGWDKYVSDKADSKGWYPCTRHKAGIFWINLKEEKLKEIKDTGLLPSLSDGVCSFKNDKFICCHHKQMYIFTSDSIGEEKESIGEGFEGMPMWDGGKRLSLTFRLRKKISMVDISSEVNPSLLWTEDCCGYPETPTFWKGKLAVPCGYQGLLIEKTKK